MAAASFPISDRLRAKFALQEKCCWNCKVDIIALRCQKCFFAVYCCSLCKGYDHGFHRAECSVLSSLQGMKRLLTPQKKDPKKEASLAAKIEAELDRLLRQDETHWYWKNSPEEFLIYVVETVCKNLGFKVLDDGIYDT